MKDNKEKARQWWESLEEWERHELSNLNSEIINNQPLIDSEVTMLYNAYNPI